MSDDSNNKAETEYVISSHAVVLYVLAALSLVGGLVGFAQTFELSHSVAYMWMASGIISAVVQVAIGRILNYSKKALWLLEGSRSPQLGIKDASEADSK